MKTKQNIIIALVTTPVIAFSGQSVLAFNITPPQPGATVIYDAEEPYNIGGTNFITRLNPLSVTELPRGGTKGLLDLLNAQFVPAGWTFQPAAMDLAGSFNITHYDAVGTPLEVGADFLLDYMPGDGDPNNGDPIPETGGQIELHWIQRVFNNHNITDNEGHGNPENIIDATIEKPFTDPGRLFYDFDVNFADPPHFEDAARRPDPANNHTWNAELYLASIDTAIPKTVTIYNGVSWGWENFCQQTAPGDGDCKDFGDAPDSYKTLLASDGPRYGEGELQRLGQLWDKELDGQPTPRADGDDIGPPFDDEDGVIFGDSWVDVIFNITRPPQNQYQLRAWWDLNENDIFDHPTEMKINDLLGLTAGITTKRYNLDFNPKDFYSRFRLTWDPNGDVLPFGEVFSRDCPDPNNPVNCISHGEVEDYAPIPEPSSPLAFLALGTLGAGSSLLRNKKHKKSAEKELEKVS